MLRLTVDVIFPKQSKKKRTVNSSKSPTKNVGRRTSQLYSGEGNQTSMSVNPIHELDKIEEENKNQNDDEILEKTSEGGNDGED